MSPAASTKRKGARKPAPTARPGGKVLFDALSAYLLDAYARGERVVLIIDEAQNLSTEALEQVRLLTNLETETQKLLQIILIGQPELRDALARPELRQLAQRITARYHLRPLDEAGTAAYLRHRLTTAGAKRFPFSADAVRRLHRRSGGVPRLINVIAERALLGGFAHDLLAIDAKTVDRAADEALAPAGGLRRSWRRPLIVAGALGLAAAAIAFALVRRPAPEPLAPSIDNVTTAAPSASARPAPPEHPAVLDGERLLQRVRTAPPDATREWATLVGAWRAPAALRATSPDACPPTPAPGWRCLRSRAPLERLLRHDRPVLLRLRAEPRATWARLLGADADRVRLSLDGATFDADRVALSGVWNGEFLAIWPAPDAVETRLAAGDIAARDWLHRRLRAERSAPTAATPEATAAALRTFQARNGLRSDGRLDADTLFALARGGDGPRLQPLQEP